MYTENYTCPLSAVNAIKLDFTPWVQKILSIAEEVRNISTVYSYILICTSKESTCISMTCMCMENTISQTKQDHFLLVSLFPDHHGNVNVHPGQ